MQNDNYYAVEWSPELMLEIELVDPDSFLKIKETLTRIGIASKKDKILYPSCHILHKKGKYFVVHFKELFALEGKKADMDNDDVLRRNTIAKLLEQWGLCKILNKSKYEFTNMTNIKVVSYSDKANWDIRPKFRMLSDRVKKD